MASFVYGSGSEKVSINGEPAKTKMNLASNTMDILVSTIDTSSTNQYGINNGIFLYDGKLHTFNSKHYYSEYDPTIDKDNWIKGIDIPHDHVYHIAVLNDGIHLLGDDTCGHYVGDGINSWTKLESGYYIDGSYYLYRLGSGVVVLNNEIHVLGVQGYNGRNSRHYKWNGNSWDRLEDIKFTEGDKTYVIFPTNATQHIIASEIVNGEIYCSSEWLTQDDIPDDRLYTKKICAWNPLTDTWRPVCTLPDIPGDSNDFYIYPRSLVYTGNNKLHIFYQKSTDNHYVLDITTNELTLVDNISDGSNFTNATLINNEINSLHCNKHHIINAVRYKEVK